MQEDELLHYGIQGMKWGIRRYQNEDGSLTEAGKRRYYGPNSEYRKAYDISREDYKQAKKDYHRSAERYGAYSSPALRISKKAMAKRDQYAMEYTKDKAAYKKSKREMKRAKQEYKKLSKQPDINTWDPNSRRAYEISKKNVKQLSDQDILDAMRRTRMEKQFVELYGGPSSKDKALQYASAGLQFVTGSGQITIPNIEKFSNTGYDYFSGAYNAGARQLNKRSSRTLKYMPARKDKK